MLEQILSENHVSHRQKFIRWTVTANSSATSFALFREYDSTIDFMFVYKLNN